MNRTLPRTAVAREIVDRRADTRAPVAYAHKVAADPRAARALTRRAGITTATGRLTAPYR